MKQRYTMKSKAKMAIIISSKADFTEDNITKDKENNFIIIRQSIYQESIEILNSYVQNNKALKHLKQNLLENCKQKQINPQL